MYPLIQSREADKASDAKLNKIAVYMGNVYAFVQR